MTPGIKHIEYYLPERFLTNDSFTHLDVDPVFMEKKIGILKRFISAEGESVGDMGEKAALKLFSSKGISPSEIDILILCTQNPDYLLPTTACILQNRLKLRTDTVCFDINLGCSGFVYACAVAISVMKFLNKRNALVITSDAYSKVISYQDKTVSTLFSDAAAATLLTAEDPGSRFEEFDFGTDGAGFENLIVPVSGSKAKRSVESKEIVSYGPGISRSKEHLYMNGLEIMKFALKEVPKSISHLLAKNNITIQQIDRIIFHQANKYMLESLTKKMSLNPGKVYINLSIGNTVSSTIPIALKQLYSENKTKGDSLALLCGFGVGYSWASAVLKINDNFTEVL